MFNFMRLPPLRRLMLMKAITGGGSWPTVTGNPVSFTAKAAPLRKLEVAFSPVQDLHGYDAPWPAGGGKNQCPDKKYQLGSKSVYIGQDNGTDFPLLLEDTTYTLSFTLAQQMEISVYLREEHAASGTLIYNGSTKNAVATVSPSVAGKYRLAIYRETGISVSNISNVQLELGSSATSYAPYENECPISGWDSVTVEQRGKNLLNPNDPNFGLYTIGPNGEETTGGGNRITSGYIPCNAGETVVADTVKVTGATGSKKWGFAGIAAFDGNKTFLERTYVNNSNAQISYTTPTGTKYVRFFEQIGPESAVTSPSVFATYEQTLAFGAITEYVPYNGRSISITIGSTVYSGTVDVVTGVLTVTHAAITVDGETSISHYSGWRFTFAAPGFYAPLSSAKITAICDRMKTITKNAMPAQNSISGGDGYSNTIMFAINSTITTVSAAHTWLADNPITVVYPLKTPVTIQLTPQEVSSLLGENNMWSDANGNLTVTYAADPATTPIVGKGKVGQAIIGG